MADVTSRPFPDRKHQLASEMLLLGRPVSAQEAYTRFGLCVSLLQLSALSPLRGTLLTRHSDIPPFPGGTSCFFVVFLLIV